jgi:gluconokinase
MTKDCIVTIELGTNGVRIVAFALNGDAVASMKGSYPTFHTHPDYSEQDPEQIFITMLYLLKNLLTEKLSGSFKVTAICFSSSMHSVLAVDRNGVPIGNAITWADNRGKKEATELKESVFGSEIYELTGTPIHPMSPLIKIAWVNRNDKERFNRTDKFLSIKSYIIQQLTGEVLIDYSLASATGLLNIHTLSWETQALDFSGIHANKLPELRAIGQSAGKLRKEYQRSLGLSPDVLVLVGSSDGCLATLGSGVFGEGRATVSIEDSGAVRVMGKKLVRDESQRLFNYYLDDGYYVSGGPTNNGGVIFEWFAKQFGDFRGPFDIEHTLTNLVRDAETVPPGSAGLIFLPYLLGERAPIWNANARGNFFGINIKHEKSHFVRATIEGILYEIYSIGKTLQTHRRIDNLTVTGSFASIPFCTQALADIYNLPVSISNSPDSIAQGAFMVCATAMNIYRDLEEAVENAPPQTTFKPEAHRHETYRKYYSIFERVTSKLETEFEEISNLQHNGV